jgi:hypothetical protein
MGFRVQGFAFRKQGLLPGLWFRRKTWACMVQLARGRGAERPALRTGVPRSSENARPPQDYHRALGIGLL